MSPRPYDHARHAGGRADIWKHFVLTEVLAHMPARPGRRFVYLETHAGPGVTQLDRDAGSAAWREGLGRLLATTASGAAAGADPIGGSWLARRADDVFGRTGAYAGSWLLAAWLLRERFGAAGYGIVGHETDPGTHKRAEGARLAFGLTATVRLSDRDGFAGLAAAEYADLVLLDPPYRAAAGDNGGDSGGASGMHDWDRVHAAAANLGARGVPFLIWYPVFWRNNPDALVNATGLVGHELAWAEAPIRPGTDFTGTGMLAGGPAEAVLAALAPALAALATTLGGRYLTRRPGGLPC